MCFYLNTSGPHCHDKMHTATAQVSGGGGAGVVLACCVHVVLNVLCTHLGESASDKIVLS